MNFDRIKTTMTFTDIIQVLSEIATDSEINTEINDQNTDSKWKYEVIRRIGAPWSWIYQFVDHCLPNLRSYNFVECQHKLENVKSVENLKSLNFMVSNIPGVGPITPVDVTNTFINYVQAKATEDNGMISPKYFKEENCPRMC